MLMTAVSPLLQLKRLTLDEDFCKLCSKGGLNLTAWISNDRNVMATIPVEHWAKGVKDLYLQSNSLPVERALWVEWFVETDTFRFKIQLKEKPPWNSGKCVLGLRPTRFSFAIYSPGQMHTTRAMQT
jgi:hypothetical protein